MTLTEMKRKVLGLIEELNPLSEFLTDDPDIQAKINEVTNQVMFELSRFKKIPKYVEIAVRMEIPIGTVKTRINISRSILRQRLKDYLN